MPQEHKSIDINALKESAARLQAYIDARIKVFGPRATPVSHEVSGVELNVADIAALAAFVEQVAPLVVSSEERHKMADKLAIARSYARASIPNADLDTYDQAISAINPSQSLVQRLTREGQLAMVRLPNVSPDTYVGPIKYLKAVTA